MLFQHFPTDMLALCLEMCDFIEIRQLWLCGSIILNKRLESEPVLLNMHLATWKYETERVIRAPTLVKRLKFLRSFSLVSWGTRFIRSRITGLDLRDLPSSLRSLNLDCSNSLELLKRPEDGSHFEVRSLFPELQGLLVTATHPLQFNDDFLLKLPRSLTKLELGGPIPAQVGGIALPLPPELLMLSVHSIIALHQDFRLPSTLKELNITCYQGAWPSILALLPSDLHIFKASLEEPLMSSLDILLLPRGLRELTAPLEPNEPAILALPPSLIGLEITSKHGSTYPEILQHLPRSLEWFHCETWSGALPESLAQLPSSLADLQLGSLVSWISPTLSRYSFPPLLSRFSTSISDEHCSSVIQSLPSSIRTLSVPFIEPSLLLRLPRSLTFLELERANLTQYFATQLPHSLTYLRIVSAYVCEGVMPNFPKTLQHIDLTIFEREPEYMDGFIWPKWPSMLRTLILRYTKVNDELLLGLPRTVTHLEIYDAALVTTDSLPIIKAMPLQVLLILNLQQADEFRKRLPNYPASKLSNTSTSSFAFLRTDPWD